MELLSTELIVIKKTNLDELYQTIDTAFNDHLKFYLLRIEHRVAQDMILLLLKWKVRLHRCYEQMKGGNDVL